MKKSLITVLSILLLSTACDARPARAVSTAPTNPTSAAAQVALKDISGHWAEATIRQSIQTGYVDGYEDQTFRPEREVSRAEFLKMVLTAVGSKTTAIPATATSAAAMAKASSNWYDTYVNQAIELGFQRKDEFQDEGMDRAMTRLEMARIAVRATDPALQKPEVSIDDRSVMYNATKKGLLQGLDAGELGPDKTTTRAQSVTIIERILAANSGMNLEIDKYAVANAELALKRTNIFTVMPEFFGGKGRPWNVDNLTNETPDGLYKAVVDRVVAVDLEDPNDPNRNILGDVESLVWWGGGNNYFNVSDYPQSYLFIVESHTEFNKDESKTMYSGVIGGLNFYLNGLESRDSKAAREGTLNQFAWVYKPNSQISNAMIIPKHGVQTRGYISLSLMVPAIPPVNSNSIEVFDLLAPKVIE
ncbi:S-layer homology domain-containing protein [Paenibacillus ginsengarvi]|uniref:S-layer homology domain-containing protein n=1 Tax=Paenibacillus ginsengarvi TaxID=400777 RepID=A0A3B0BGR5_9BACL|nr:S-layer homology domain-containing protein [Paenibacillus ginsengarvi]RKN71852.1 S-layer homology domain-containing protein [Paenibacillus ginsengarvi]